VAIAIAGCGSSKDAPASCDGGCWQPTPTDETFIDNFCAAIGPCCTRIGEPENADGCKASLQSSGFSGSATLTAACLAELQQIGSTPGCFVDIANLDDPCTRVFYEPSGPLQPGQTCTSNADCAGTTGQITSCLSVDPNRPPVCVARATGGLGDSPCLGTMNTNGVILDYGFLSTGSTQPKVRGVVCQESAGLYCDSSSGKCVALLAPGATCGGAQPTPCSSACGSDNVCKEVVSVNQSCSAAICDGSSYCDPASSTCLAKLADGAACSDNAQCSGNCLQPTGSGGTCSPLTGGTVLALGLGFCI
jgi:hypothetical protein